ncbi:MAG TPA: hypothetical protein VFI14_12450 [Chryseosolibacter sp.]|nr:hypothetical protein [Chryseosolibacter sp.]
MPIAGIPLEHGVTLYSKTCCLGISDRFPIRSPEGGSMVADSTDADKQHFESMETNVVSAPQPYNCINIL